MNNTDPEFIDDDQLDSMISNVEVPQGLRDQLKKIPIQRELKKGLASAGNDRWFGIIPIRSKLLVPAITIAAALLIGFCLFMFWKPGLNRAPIAKENETKTVKTSWVLIVQLRNHRQKNSLNLNREWHLRIRKWKR